MYAVRVGGKGCGHWDKGGEKAWVKHKSVVKGGAKKNR